MTDVIAAAIAPPIDWEINFLVDYGPLWFLTAHALGLLALICGIGTVIHVHDRRKEHRKEVA